jgi:hypothetical protein
MDRVHAELEDTVSSGFGVNVEDEFVISQSI